MASRLSVFKTVVIQKLQLKRRREQMVQEIDKKLKELDAEFERIVQERNTLRDARSILLRDKDAGATRKPPTYQDTVRQAICEVLAAEQPLHRKDILKRVKARGTPITAKDELRTITYHLSRDDRFENVSKGTWQLAEDAKSETPNDGRMRLIK